MHGLINAIAVITTGICSSALITVATLEGLDGRWGVWGLVVAVLLLAVLFGWLLTLWDKRRCRLELEKRIERMLRID